MKTVLGILHKSLFLFLSIIFLLTACQPMGNAVFQESASLTALPSDSSDTECQEVHNAPSEAAPSESASQTLSSQNAGSASALSELQVHFIDVGQGDSTLIICGNESMLIDAGGNDKGTAIQLYLQKQGIEKLTYLIGTHPDSDHIGGLDVIMTKYDCGTIIMPEITSDTASYRDVIDTMEYRNYKNTPPQAGDIYSLGDAEFTIIAPCREYADANNSSVGIKLVHGNNVFLFTGDAETEAETDMLQNGIDLGADVLHAGHHGSSMSNSPDFISTVSPAYAVISCGSDNPYGHPHKRVLETLKEHGVQIFRTDELGSIVAVSDGTFITWTTKPSQTIISTPENNTITYVLNHNTNKFHEPGCSSVNNIKDYNREDTTLSREEIIAAGFVPCKSCNP